MEDPDTRPTIEYLNRFLHDLFIRTGGGDDLIEASAEAAAAEADASRLQATISALEKRVKELESSDGADISRLLATISALQKRICNLEESIDTDSLISKIAKLNQKVNKLIEELLAAVKANAPDRELEHKAFCIQNQTLRQLQLLNLRTEEAFETEIDEDDV